ncbi:flagellar autonomy 2 protein [Volvox carteri f. nagariensis]|uniref:non-specific serine/threonine protein kinase n=1 Tax=Volvox carteri f. nagariensis TaxID=3068 RepID=D8TVJ1_VOLCA|nr:flagellar autonomy 2 protein [Volvox carteri f. nagariensis]EFJ48588.1 flagellar autonomy 2 protein [Volvox carteri f. nagariensis]|eukprot:XP_002950387.1 flagellar autonomy 2 protein [Volvox carteri f. nagariensis]
MAAPAAPNGRLAEYDLKYIDKGAFGAVYKAVRKSDGREFAVKQVDLSQIKTRMETAMAIDEARMLSQLNHPHVIRYYDSFIDAENRLNIVMEYASKGSVKELLKKFRGRAMPEDGVWRIVIQTLLGLHYLHSKKIIHRDIKSANLFIDANDNIKIGDLGVARALSASSNLARTQLGTPYYLAPEVCEDKPYNIKSDIWSLGVVLYECCMGCYPFDVDNNNEAALIRKIVRGQFKPVQGPFSPALIQLVTSCLTFKPESRPDTSLLLRNPALVAKAKALNIDLNPRPAPDDKGAFAAPKGGQSPPAAATPPAAAAPAGHPFIGAAGSPGPAGMYASPQQPQRQPPPPQQSPQYPYQQSPGGAYSPYNNQPGGGGRAPANHPFALPGGGAGAGPAQAYSPPPHPYNQRDYNGSPPGGKYGQASPGPPPYAVHQNGDGPRYAWEDLAADVNKIQIQESEVARQQADRLQQAKANLHAGKQDHAKDVIYGGPQDSGPKVQRLSPNLLPAAGKRPTSAHAGAPFATHFGAAAGFQTQAHASMNDAWKAQYQPPQYGRRRNPELQITGPSLRSGGPRGGGGGGGRAGFVPAADDATTYVSSTSYYTSNR